MGGAREGNPAINVWPEEDRPREKLIMNGAHVLSSSELLAILLRTGVRGESAVDIARKVIRKFRTFREMSRAGIDDWREFKGLGKGKFAQIQAAIEIGRRLGEEAKRENPSISSSRDVSDMLMPRMRDLPKEIFKVIFLDSRGRIIDIVDIAEGSVNQAFPVIREVFQQALRKYAVSMICCHNHPSGKPFPSPEDRDFTAKLCKVGEAMDIIVLDHVIIGDNEYYSFADKGDLPDKV